jgi:hypothetical protein
MNDLTRPLADLATAMKYRSAPRVRVSTLSVVLTALAALATLALVLSL